MKKGRSSIILLLVILLFIAGAVYFLYTNGIIALPNSNGSQAVFEKNDLFFVSKVGNEKEKNIKYGIVKSDGTVIIEAKYDKMLRNDNSVYIKDSSDSYIFFLQNNKSVSLGGRETDITLAYDKNTGYPLPYFILVYGDKNAKIYRIYTIDGVRYTNKDFTTLNEAYEFLGARVDFTPEKAGISITDKYQVSATLTYPTSQGRSQYVVTGKQDRNNTNPNLKYGIVDEAGRIIVDIDCDSIKELEGKVDGVVLERNNKTYVFLKNEKLIEVDSGFEFTSGRTFIYQKKGSTANKVYNLTGELVVDGIYAFPKDFSVFETLSGITYIFTNENGIYSLYNVTNNKLYDTKYSNISAKYIEEYKDTDVWSTGFIYISDNIPYCVDFSNMKKSQMNIVCEIFSLLDIGYVYGSN